ncbi:MAG TPA: alanine--tRNA ligase [Ktedonobacterales bacterium]|nr:alanine--tRNA ligase [Ktedonobacterales bacterium]
MPVGHTWTSAEIRATFLDYFESNGHTKVPSSSLIPRNDPTVLLTTAGMQQMIPYFLGRETPPAIRLTSAQKCFRTTDIDKVGNERSLTFFEMLGNFSVGNYFKREAIGFAWELLTRVYGLPPELLHPTVHPDDDEAPRYWHEVAGYPDEAITRLEDNWWGPPGASGPCGPDSEVYYDRGPEHGCGRADCRPGCDCERFLEIWNLVFMQFYQDIEGKRAPLARQNIDTGMGLERLSMVLQDKESVFDTDLFRAIIDRFAELLGTSYGRDAKVDASLRVIADHGRALVFLAADGVLPSNEGRGHVFRRILRRAVRHGKLLGLDKPFLAEAADTVINLMKGHYTELAERRDQIVEVLSHEERKFGQTLSLGLQLLNEVLDNQQKLGENVVPGEVAFRLYDTHGFPLELTQEVAAERDMLVDVVGFEGAMQRQQERSKQPEVFAREREEETWGQLAARVPPTEFTGYGGTMGASRIVALMAENELQDAISAPQIAAVVLEGTPFYAESGGQIGDRGTLSNPTGTFEVLDTRRPVPNLIVHYGRMIEGHLRVGSEAQAEVNVSRREDTMRNHSATHLLHRALKEILGEQVQQKGSLVEPERLRFDFNHPRALTDEEVQHINRLVNEWIRNDFHVETAIMPLQEALTTGAMHLFGEKYGEQVRVVTMGRSKELCGGTHCHATGQIGIYLTTQEVGIAAGIRRIEALTGRAAEAHLTGRTQTVDALAAKLQTSSDALETRVDQLVQDLAAARRRLAQLDREAAREEANQLASAPKTVSGIPVVAAEVSASDDKTLREMGDQIRSRLGSGVVVLAAALENRVAFIVGVTPDLTKKGLNAGKIAAAVGERLGGKGGGRPDSGQGGGKDRERLPHALTAVTEIVQAHLELEGHTAES